MRRGVRHHDELRAVARGGQVEPELGVALAHHLRDMQLQTFGGPKNVLIRDETISEGSIDQSAVHVREVIKRAMELGSAAIILVHNHPSGDPSPSSADVQMTRQIADVAKPLGITVHDHLIIGKADHVSMKALKLI